MFEFSLLFKDLYQDVYDYMSIFDTNIRKPIDVYLKDGKMYIDMVCLGVKKADIDVGIENNKITVEVPSFSKPDPDKRYLREGIHKTGFKYGLMVDSVGYDIDKTKVSLSDNMLTLEIPEKETRNGKKPLNITEYPHL